MAVKQTEKRPEMKQADTVRESTAQITPQVALESLLVSWLCLRDFALWAFVQGVEAPLSDVDLSQIETSVAQMNAMHGAVMHFARQIAGKNDPVPVLKEAIAKVRREHEPLFPLTVQGIPSAF
jgi:hypothetical protein